MHSIVDKLLTCTRVELEHYEKSHWNFAIELLPLSLAPALLCCFPLIFFPSLKIACGLAYSVMLAWLLRDNWKRIGTRRVVLDLANKQLIMNQRFPHDPYARSEVIPFADLLLHRHWRSDDESRSAAFVIRVQIGKNVERPDCGGYFLHEEFALRDPAAADAASLKLVDDIVRATGLEFFDVQASTAPRYSVWVNQSLQRDP